MTAALRRLPREVLEVRLCGDVEPIVTVADLVTGAVAVTPLPRPRHPDGSERIPSEVERANAAAPDSPVGRTITRLAADPQANDPLRRLERRIGRELLPLTSCTDVELQALTGALLAEIHRRSARWITP